MNKIIVAVLLAGTCIISNLAFAKWTPGIRKNEMKDLQIAREADAYNTDNEYVETGDEKTTAVSSGMFAALRPASSLSGRCDEKNPLRSPLD